jgi:hypothetical protein
LGKADFYGKQNGNACSIMPSNNGVIAPSLGYRPGTMAG